MARKLGLCPLLGRGAGTPSSTMWPVQRPTSTPSAILINPAVWPQYTNVTDRTDSQTGQDRTGQPGQTENGPIAYHTAKRFTDGRPNSDIMRSVRDTARMSTYSLLLVCSFGHFALTGFEVHRLAAYFKSHQLRGADARPCTEPQQRSPNSRQL